MSSRHLSRSVVMQTLFEWDFLGLEHFNFDDVLDRNIAEFAPGINETPFMHELLEGIMSKRDVLDSIIEKAAPDWPIDKIATVDRNILRIGLYELLFADRGEVPPKVAINEAIELAKSFGGEASGRFVNGVLGSVYRELGEPGKDQTSKKKIKDIPYEQMPIEKLGGAVVFCKHDGEFLLGLVHDIFGYWTLSKGHIDEAMEEIAAVAEKVQSEISLAVNPTIKLGDNEYIAADPEKGKIRKQVVYYLAEAEYGEINLPEDKGGLDDAAWFKLTDILELNFYDDILPIVTKAVNHLLQDEATKEAE